MNNTSLTHEGDALFSIRDLSYTYPNGTRALTGINLTIHPSDTIALVGQNGSGKSTLIRHLNGILPLQSGELLYRREPLQPARLPIIRQQIGILFQDPDNHLFCNTIYEDVAFGPMSAGKAPAEVEQLVHQWLQAVELEHHKDRAPHHLSYGQKKRAALAAILATEPDILILDEPSANLDPRQENIIQRILLNFAGPLVVIDHDLLFLYKICNRAIVLADGVIQQDCSMDELVGNQEKLRDYGLDFTFRFTCCGTHAPPAEHHHHHSHTHDHDGHAVHAEQDSATPAPLIELQHYSFHYPDNAHGISDVNLCINHGDSIALIGENGAGKSTLAHCLMGLNQEADGYFFFDSRQVTKALYKDLWRHIGMVFQHSADQLFCSSCWEEVAFGPQQLRLPKAEVADRVANALGAMQLEDYRDAVPLHLSGGQRKRLAIATVLAMKPEVLILDEPTPYLDQQNQALLLVLLAKLNVTKILITHDLHFIRELTNRTIVMHQGRITRDYLTSEFLVDHHLQAVNGLDYTYKNSCIQTIQQLQQENR